jgi:hypothetical protein
LTQTNFIALVPRFKFEASLTFVLACDAIGLHFLRQNFLELVDSEPETSFVIGDGLTIASDDRCRLTVITNDDVEKSEIVQSNESEFTWRVSRTDATAIAAKVLSLLTSNVPGHQYLEVQRGCYRSVVVTKQEYPVETIRAMRDGRAPIAR